LDLVFLRSVQAYLLLTLVLLALLGVAHIALRSRAWLEARRLRRRLRRAARGQAQARRYLEQRGFSILAEEHEVAAELEVDGQRVAYSVRIDYLVGKGRRTYGVEVKTGERATDPANRSTRRQLLEYSQLLRPALDGLFLLDMDTPRLMRIRFPDPAVPRSGRWLWVLGVGFALGALAATLLGRH
jgi:hypothetical protein